MGIHRFKDYDLNLLVTLHVLLEERNVTRAAKRLGVTQSAASRSLSRLREQLDDEVLVRARGQMVPTPRAEAMQAPLKRVLHELGVMLFTIEEIDPATLQRRFRLGMSDYPMVPVLPALVDRLAREAPKVSFAMRPLPTDIDAPLVEGELDLVVCPKQPSTAGIVWSLLARDRFVSICRVGHPRVRRSMDLDAFLRERHLLVAPDGETPLEHVDRALMSLGREREVLVHVPSFHAATQLILSSDLVATLPSALVSKLPSDRVQVFACPVALDGITLHAAWHERMRHDRAHKWFRGVVAEVMADLVSGPTTPAPTDPGA